MRSLKFHLKIVFSTITLKVEDQQLLVSRLMMNHIIEYLAVDMHYHYSYNIYICLCLC